MNFLGQRVTVTRDDNDPPAAKDEKSPIGTFRTEKHGESSMVRKLLCVLNVMMERHQSLQLQRLLNKAHTIKTTTKQAVLAGMGSSKAWFCRAVCRTVCSFAMPVKDEAEFGRVPSRAGQVVSQWEASLREPQGVERSVALYIFLAVVWQTGDTGPTDAGLFPQKQTKEAGTQDARIGCRDASSAL